MKAIMGWLRQHYRHVILGGSCIIAVFLRWWGLGSLDVQSDLSLNAVRALGWLDYLGDAGQTTPITWFGHIPWWGLLSFHDHPPLVFAVQHVFFLLFGDSTFVVFLPFALASLLTVVLLYWVGTKILSPAHAIVITVLASVSSYAVWVGRSGYLETFQLIFITLAVYFLYRTIVDKKNNAIILFWVAVGLGMLTKYTSLFLIPAGLITMALLHRTIFKTKQFWVGVLLFFIALSPVIIYNIMLFQTRGHFDAALSSMVGMHPTDFAAIAERGVGASRGANILGIGEVLSSVISWPMMGVFVISVIYLVYKLLRKKTSLLETLLLVAVFFLLAQFAFSGVAARFVPLVLPFCFFISAIGIVDLWRSLHGKQLLRAVLVFVLGLIVAGELAYAINTNLLISPWGPANITYSSERFYRTGFNDLDRYVRKHILTPLPQRQHITQLEQAGERNFDVSTIILIDDRADWHSLAWYMARYSTYYKVPLIYLSRLSESKDLQSMMSDVETFAPVPDAPVKQTLWFVYATPVAATSHFGEGLDVVATALANKLDAAGVIPEAEIRNAHGVVAFKVYHFVVHKAQ